MPSLEITIEYDNPDIARTVLESILPDNVGYVESSIDGSILRFRMESESAGTLRNTADDLLACIKIAESASGLVTGAVADLDGDAFLE